ncbi:MAG: hypothetical protein K2M43_00180 [Mycoplasmoidaceae bacterium]|nr:hypothetical protein [Mycoplasmoidaceae bacterium]
MTTKIQSFNALNNKLSKEIGAHIAKGEREKAEEIKAEVKKINIEIAELSKQEEELSKQLDDILHSIPNLPDKTVPIGVDENDNPEVKRFSEPTKFDFKFLPH